ncbi:uncharacterized protein PRCAT00002152001 [Priceomyces carsonii]|uniref:uncharacterized protein n=1 Tax=Priceomyces carsonii TaxID=28549 RepID=UPI002ED9D52E|nr:unnamed protein product [Priceomyces carsonii]
MFFRVFKCKSTVIPARSVFTWRSYSRQFSARPSTVSGNKTWLFLGGVTLLGSGIGLGLLYSLVKFDNHKIGSTTPLETVEPTTYADSQQFKTAISQIRDIVGDDNVSRNEDVIKAQADSFFSTHHPPDPISQRPGVVVYPTSTEQVSQILKVANKYKVPVVASSGLTSLEGQLMHVRGPNSVSLSFEKMDKILAVHPDDLDVVVQPGVGWEELDEFLRSKEETKHLMFGPDPGMGAKIGGMVGTSCSGTNAYKYGTMKENVLNLTVVLADGTILKTRQRPKKSSAGYDLTRLFIGSEGTLGIITEATIKLHVRPKVELVSILSFPNIELAASTAGSISKTGIQLNAIELLNETMVHFVNKYGGVVDQNDRPKTFSEKPTLLLKIGGPSKQSVDEQIKLISQISKENGLLSFESSKDENGNAILWSARRAGLWSTIQYGSEILDDPNDVQVWSTDIVVPVSHLSRLIKETNDDLNSLGFKGKFSVAGHVGDGNCHFMILYNSKDYRKVESVVDRMVYRSLEHEGSCTGEHGVGVGKRKYLNDELGVSAVDLMRHIKLLLDPKRILNPDKVLKLDTTDNLDEQLEHVSLIESSNKHCC